jgi:PBP1b-binding outer membrane lipoprotein LpoB
MKKVIILLFLACFIFGCIQETETPAAVDNTTDNASELNFTEADIPEFNQTLDQEIKDLTQELE